jgi:ABC-type hemin transport system substrate-binding protein
VIPVLRFILAIGVLAAAACDRRPGAAPVPSAASAEPRIVTLSPAIAIIVRDLGLEREIVGRDGYDMVLPKDVPVCGVLGQIDYETLLRVRPTIILMQLGELAAPAKLNELTKERRWEVRNYNILSLDEIRAATGGIASVLNVPERGRELTAKMDAAWSRREGAQRAGRILLLESVNPPAALGPGSFHQQLLERLGGIPAISSGKPYVTLDAEDVLRLAPDGIIFLSPRPAGSMPVPIPSEQEIRAALGRIGTLDIPAVRSGHLAVIDDPLELTPSTAMIGLAEEMAGVLREWAK